MPTTMAPQLAAPQPPGRSFGWVDVLVVTGLLGLLWTALHFGHGMLVHFDAGAMPALDPSPAAIPYYAGRTLLRMWIAFACSLCFAVTVGYVAARHRTARMFILPALDVLQSVPVLGFLSATVTAFMALFPGSLLGVECAAIFAIFTGQVCRSSPSLRQRIPQCLSAPPDPLHSMFQAACRPLWLAASRATSFLA